MASTALVLATTLGCVPFKRVRDNPWPPFAMIYRESNLDYSDYFEFRYLASDRSCLRRLNPGQPFERNGQLLERPFFDGEGGCDSPQPEFHRWSEWLGPDAVARMKGLPAATLVGETRDLGIVRLDYELADVRVVGELTYSPANNELPVAYRAYSNGRLTHVVEVLTIQVGTEAAHRHTDYDLPDPLPLGH